MMAYLRDDKLTGLLRRTYFEELVKRDWGLAQRETRRLSFLVFDLDCFATYKDTFGKPGADQSLRRISRVISGCFRRASDPRTRRSPARNAAGAERPASCA